MRNGKWGKHIVNFDPDNSSSIYADNRKNNIKVLGERPTDGLDDTTITTEDKYSVKNFKSKKIVWSLHYNVNNKIITIV